MQTIKILQSRPEFDFPSEQSNSEKQSFVDEVSLHEGSDIYRRYIALKWKDARDWFDTNVGISNYGIYGKDPFSFLPSEPEPDPNYIVRFTYLSFRDNKDQFRIIILTQGIVYIMNERGQTIDTF